MVGWRLREGMEEINLQTYYVVHPTLFSIRLQYGGKFSGFPGRKYIKGKEKYVDLVNSDLFSVHEIHEMLGELGCFPKSKIIYYHFKRPLGDLDYDLFPLGSDEDMNHFRSYVLNHKLMEVYTEYWPANLPRMEHSIEPNMEPPSEPFVEPTSEPFLELPSEPFMEPHDEPDVETLESSYSEESEGDDSESEDSDFFVDEDNMLDDPEVDMKDFYLNIDKNVEWVGGINAALTDNIVSSDEEIEVINTDVLLSGSSSDEGGKSRRRNKVRAVERAMKNNASDVSDPFYIYQTFTSAQEVKDIIYLHAIETRRELVIVKNDKNRIRTTCNGTIPDLGMLDTYGPRQTFEKGGPSQTCEKGGPSQTSKKKGQSQKSEKRVKESNTNKCPWVLLVSKWKKDDDWTVKTYEKEHRCLQSREIKACNYKFLSKQILEQLESNPEIPIRALKEQVERKYQLQVSDMKVFRAKSKALETIRGDFSGQYSLLRDYILELQKQNPNTTVKIEVDTEPNSGSDTKVFRRIYVCLGSLKKGFAAGKRDLLGLDGSFMKGPYPGMILTAVGLDGNNCTYPLAYAVVESENTNSWTWFLSNLADDLDKFANSNFTFITDRQKGLKNAVKKVFPCAEHRYCLRHLHENMKLKWRGKEFKNYLWKCAISTTVQEFNTSMEELKKLNNAAYKWLKAIPPKQWSRSHFTGRAHCDALLNNMCEALNSKLLKGRDKPIITCLEFIREYIMKKLVIVQKTIDKSSGPLTPTATRTLEKIKTEAAQFRAVFCGNGKYQVTGEAIDQFVVDMRQQTCSCNKWEITGMPCKHTIAAIWEMRRNKEDAGIPESWVHPTYWLKTWKEMYAFKISPINGRSMWVKSPCPTYLVPPKHHVPIGRPKKKRRRSATEDDGARNTRTVRCSKCGNMGHNGRSCKGQSGGGGQSSGIGVGRGTTGGVQSSGRGVGRGEGGGEKSSGSGAAGRGKGGAAKCSGSGVGRGKGKVG